LEDVTKKIDRDHNIRREDLTTKPTNKVLDDAIKDRGTAYLMVFRELKARYGEDEAKDVMRSASRAHGLYWEIARGLRPEGLRMYGKRFREITR
jgi:hypothetical protein